MGCNKDRTNDAVAELHRFLVVGDEHDTHIFTFLLQNPFDHNFEKVQSREFMYAHNRWRTSIVKSENHLNFFLELREATEGLTCSLDFSFGVLNRDDVTRNESYSEAVSLFTKETSEHGRRSFITKDELLHDGYLDENKQFLVEFQMRNAKTSFSTVVNVAPRMHETFPRFQSTYFPYGGFDWNVSVYPNGDWAEHEGRVMINLNRLTQFNQLCRLGYRVTLGDDVETKCYRSDVLGHIFDFSGNGQGFMLYDDLERYTNNGELKIVVELVYISVIHEIKMYVFEEQSRKNQVFFSDRDRQAWCLETNVSHKNLLLNLAYVDQYRLPTNYARYVRWDIVVVGAAGQCKRTLDGPYSAYFVKQADENEYEMATELPIKELSDPAQNYFPDDEGPLRLKVHVEFKISHLLYKAHYDKQDDVSKRQIHQLKSQLVMSRNKPSSVSPTR
ncbi:uncharacterized protein LOC100370664 [Saccoglossus kowalevskii]|uniref:Uncharacterized protein LOC100370664 n=1 Tax=Saccoglossus kowalevskii TaxID=10224 RepID=A0ABM0MEG6_SACKO|nr:PREDICTED: uncharacterized protein LOC100370664 [Saccoglossus kowalevskii]